MAPARATPERVRVHDFIIPRPRPRRKAIPYGVYDLHRNEGWVSVGIDHDTASFAVQRDPPLVAAHGAAGVSAAPGRC